MEYILFSHKKEWNLAICNNMDGAREYNAKKYVRERQVPYDFIHMWNLRSKTNEQKKKERDRQKNTLKSENKLMVTTEEGKIKGIKSTLTLKEGTIS